MCQGEIVSASHKVSLVYFSTFEPIDLTPDSIMQRAAVPMLYDSASNPRLPCLYICPVADVLGCAPAFHFSSAATVTPRFHTASRAIGVIDGSEPMQNDQAYFFSDIFLKFYNIIEIIVENKIYNIIKHYIVLK
jgi:hypothetical protein